jgi:hypothetical protein
MFERELARGSLTAVHNIEGHEDHEDHKVKYFFVVLFLSFEVYIFVV